jgi:biotin carboxyl carrier protein
MKIKLKIQDNLKEIEFFRLGNQFNVKLNGESHLCSFVSESSKSSVVLINGVTKNINFISPDVLIVDGNIINIKRQLKRTNKDEGETPDSMLSPMPGKILKVFKKAGDNVLKAEPILIMEAMKMEHTIRAPKDGVIEKIYFSENDQVSAKVELVKLK